ncbi:hypothetical protein [Nocardia miyunensis]|uniref:hypothetical protein n=1 Tax=Nocardia miyunensis TaxID=282684 RepID=UPI00082F7E49|nr:hypothetical protein [Nocardia miyunensis]
MSSGSQDERMGWGWLDEAPEPQPDPTNSRGGVPDEFPSAEPDSAPEPVHRTRRRMPLRGWLLAAAVLALAVGAITAGIAEVTRKPTTVAPPPISAAPRPTVTATSGPACAGLSGPAGTIVTDQGGDRDTLSGVIAAFEFGYYAQRSVAAVTPLLAPDAGLDPARLAAGIASIPTGTRHCVAITPLSGNAADVHIVEVHPDGTRVDYLQVIDVRIAVGATVITNIQKAG